MNSLLYSPGFLTGLKILLTLTQRAFGMELFVIRALTLNMFTIKRLSFVRISCKKLNSTVSKI